MAIILTGGKNVHGSASKKVFRYSIEFDNWEVLPEMKQGRIDHGSCILRDKLYVVGGVQGTAESLDPIEMLELATAKAQW